MEAKQLRTYQHKYIVKYIDEFLHVEFSPVGPKYAFMIIMEYCKGGDLMQLLTSQKLSYIKGTKGMHFEEELIMKWLLQIIQAIKYLHDRNAIHRDLKCGNIFISEDQSIRVGDFGLSEASKILPHIKTSNLLAQVGIYIYIYTSNIYRD